MSEFILKNVPLEIYQYIFHFLNPISKPVVCPSLININWCSRCGEYLKGVYYLNYQTNDYICLECYQFNNRQINSSS